MPVRFGRYFLWSASPVLLFLSAGGCALETGGSLASLDGQGPESEAMETDWTFEPDGADSPGEPAPDGGPDAPRTCADAGPAFCDDGKACTLDLCSDGIDGPVCSHTVEGNFCHIDEACYVNGSADPANECMVCLPVLSGISWSRKDDRTPCAGGLCCGGECRVGGTCCASTDCPGCTGNASDCSIFLTDPACNSQAGCSWMDTGYCSGEYNCSDFNGNDLACGSCGCTVDTPGDCDGDNTAFCPGHSTPAECGGSSLCGCFWTATGGGQCGGVHTPCNTYTPSTWCSAQSGCSWAVTGTCDPVTYICVPTA